MIKPELNGVTETMLQSFYARALYSENKKNNFKDEKAEEIVSLIDYDFSEAKKDITMNSGVIARSIVLDEIVSEYIQKYPDCTVVNVACGLDTRFYRMDNGTITWYNLDVPEVINLRKALFKDTQRVFFLPFNVLDVKWTKQVKKRNHMLFIIEGLTMYMTESEVQSMLQIIYDAFDHAYICMETLCPFFVRKEKIEISIQTTGAAFLWGANSFEDIKRIAPGYKKVKDDDIVRGMCTVSKVYKWIMWMPIVHKIAQKILVFEKQS